jgi:c-di-GMP-binding flagellar brake protein YcgR
MSANSSQTEKTLCDAVARNAGIVLSIPSLQRIQNIKSRFLAQNDIGIWAELDFDAAAQAQGLVDNQGVLAVSFRIGRQRVTFATQAIQVEREFQFNEFTVVPAVQIVKPTEINVTQRRSAYRVTLFEDSELSVRIWMIEDHVYLGDRPTSVQEIKSTHISDASIGGLGIRIARERARDLLGGQRLRVLLTFRGIELLLDARLRFTPRHDTANFIAAGVMFKKLDTDVDARQKSEALTHMIGELQLEEVQRCRVSIAS